MYTHINMNFVLDSSDHVLTVPVYKRIKFESTNISNHTHTAGKIFFFWGGGWMNYVRAHALNYLTNTMHINRNPRSR